MDTKNITLTQHMTAMVEKAIALIQHEAATFVPTAKVGYDGLDTDLVTTADIAAQEMYQKYIEEYFPEEGIIGEENLHKTGTNYRYFTIDPLDGTKAYGRRQSTGVGTMIAHVNEFGVVDAVCIGDVNTGEMYYFGPDTKPTRKRFGVESLLDIRQMRGGYVSLRKHPEDLPKLVQDLVKDARGGFYKDIGIDNGSIGVQLAKLWKGEVEMVVIEPSFETPWDMTPIAGMNKAMNIVHIALDPETFEVLSMEKPLVQQTFMKNHIELITHAVRVPEVLEWIKEWKMKNT